MPLISDILKALAPRTPLAKRERFVPFLEEAVERYSINTELRLAAFLATCCFESDYFKTTVEYKASESSAHWKKYQSKYWDTGFYGRGLIQLTHRKNYERLRDHIADRIRENVARDGNRGKVYPNPVTVPDSVATPEIAVISACFFWQENNLNKYADKGQFFAIQGLVNRGDAKKEALDYPTRLRLYDAALRAIPDDHNSAAANTGSNPSPTTNDTDEPSPEPAKPSADQQQKPILDRITSPLISVKEKFDALGVQPGTISKSSAVATITTKVLGWVMTAAGFVSDNPVWFIMGGVVVVAGLLYLAAAKRNATTRVVSGL